MKSSKVSEYVSTVLTGLLVSYMFLHQIIVVTGQFEFSWQSRDSFDEVKRKFDDVTPNNCEIKHRGELYLPPETVTHKPDIKDININPVFPNRTALLHLHNMALNRAFYWSYILQSRFIRPAINDTYDPGMMYYFLSTVADVAANEKYFQIP